MGYLPDGKLDTISKEKGADLEEKVHRICLRDISDNIIIKEEVLY
jgi:hypothetical protein